MANLTNAVSLYDPLGLYDSRPSFSHVSSVESPVRLVYTAGQTGEDKDGKVAPGGFENQARLALQNVKTCLTAAGASVRDITKLTFYVVNWAENKDHFGLPLMEFLTDNQGIYRPPSTLISVAGLVKPELLVEIEAVAAIPISKETNVDVIVVGAGLSGLQAANDIQEAGLSCVVLEARDRVGGKTLSIELDGGNGVVDAGAAWLNETTQPRIYALAKRYGLETVVQRTSGDEVMQNLAGDFARVNLKNGEIPSVIPMDDLATVQKIEGLLETKAASIDIRNPGTSPCENMTAAEFFIQNGAKGDSFETLSTTVKGLLGVDADELSLSFYLDYIRSGGTLQELQSDESNGGQYQRLRQGMQTISKRLAGDLKPRSVHLNSPVSNIQQTTSGCVIKTSNGSTYHAKKVIVTIPTPLYRTITFSPPLPTNKATLSDSTTLGYYAKTILVYANPWWRDADLRGSFSSLAGPVSFSRDTCVPEDNQYSITCFIVGNTGRKWSILSPRDRQRAVLDQIATLSGPELAPKVYNTVQIIEQEWIKEPWSQGAPSPVMKPGLLEEFGAALREPFEHIHFAGTETAFEWKGYMDGAIRAGERAAMEIIEIL